MKKWNIIITCGIILLLILVLTPNEDKLNLLQKCRHHTSLKGVACNNSKLEHEVITEKARNAFLQEAQPNVTSEKLQNVGFFSPDWIDDSIFHTDFSVMNAYLKFSNSGQKIIDIEHLRQNLEAVKGLKHKIYICIGPVISDVRAPSELKRTYITSEGERREKVFAALSKNKLYNIVNNAEIEKRLDGFVDLVNEYRENIGVIFIVDEPYLNGIDELEIERAVRKIKQLFELNNIHDIQLGLIFAGAMFNSQFAIYIDDAFKQYVIHVDDNYYQKKHLVNEDSKEARSFRKWFVTFQKTRLTTYDTSGNIITGGGIPHGLDVVAFDFYLSTLLFDHMYDRVLDWFAKNRGNAACDFFKGKCISDVRKTLSFFKDGPITADKLYLKRDREILDRAFDCRIETTVDLLRQEIKNSGQNNIKIMLIGESSTNGLFEFNDRGIIEQDQPLLLVELRMLDEVKRALQYYTENMDGFKGGLAFFLYPNAYDQSINLFISGVKGAPSVLNYIYKQRNLIMEKPDRSQKLIEDIKKKTVGYYAGFLDEITISKITGLSIEEIEAVTKRTSR